MVIMLAIGHKVYGFQPGQGLDIFTLQNMEVWCFLEGTNHRSHTVTGPICVGMFHHLPVHEVQHVPDSLGHMRTGLVLHHDDTPCEHSGTLSLYGSMNVSLSRIVLYIDGHIKVDNSWYQETE
jgi:hypothetical protein